MRRASQCLFATAVAMLATPASAVETGLSIYPKGLEGFMSGVLPPKDGFYLSGIYYYFSGSAGTEVRNGNVELNVDVTENAGFLEGIYVTDWHFLGGTYAFGGAVPIAGADLKASVVTAGVSRDISRDISIDNGGFADSLVIPAMLNWSSGNFHWLTSLFLYVPTAPYHTGQLNLGRNIWGFMPQLALTYFDPKSGLDLSAAVTYVTMTKNSATDYASGDILHVDWGLGLHFGGHAEWEAGVLGNIMQQVTPDHGSGAQLGPNEARSIGIGAGVNYSGAIGRTPVVLGLKWEHDVDSANTFSGDVVSAQVTVGL